MVKETIEATKTYTVKELLTRLGIKGELVKCGLNARKKVDSKEQRELIIVTKVVRKIK